MAQKRGSALSPDSMESISQRLTSLSLLIHKPSPAFPPQSPPKSHSPPPISDQSTHPDHFNSTETLSTGDLEAGDSDLSFQSSAYSRTSQKEAARTLTKARAGELRRIREDSKSIQQAVKTKVRKSVPDTETSDWDEELQFYDAELERMKAALTSLLPSSASTQQLRAELASIRQEVKSLESRLEASEGLRASTPCLSLQITELQGSFQALSARLTSDSAACRSCVLF